MWHGTCERRSAQARRVLRDLHRCQLRGAQQCNSERNGTSNVARMALLHWGLLDASEYENAADVVVGSDLTYNSGLWVALAKTMSAVLKPGGYVV